MKMSNYLVNIKAKLFGSLCDDGKISIYTSPQPRSADTKTDSQILLAELNFKNPAFADPIEGVIQANYISPEKKALTSGIASWYRITTKSGLTLCDGSVGEGEDMCDLILSSKTIEKDSIIKCIAFFHAEVKG